MNTQEFDKNPEKGGVDSQSEKSARIKKAVGNAAQFAGAAGIGAAGTMAANAMNGGDENMQDEVPVEYLDGFEAVVEAVSAESVAGFDPNEIMIEDVEEVVEQKEDATVASTSSTGHNEDIAMEIEPEPITGIEHGSMHEDVVIVDIDSPELNESEELWTEEPDEGWDVNDNPTTLLADNDIDENPDILGDILNA